MFHRSWKMLTPPNFFTVVCSCQKIQISFNSCIGINCFIKLFMLIVAVKKYEIFFKNYLYGHNLFKQVIAQLFTFFVLVFLNTCNTSTPLNGYGHQTRKQLGATL